MPSVFICWSSWRISGFSTAAPNHHQRTMGLASGGGFLKLDLRDSIGDCAGRLDAAMLMETIVSRRACGNLAEKGAMVWITPAWWRRWCLRLGRRGLGC